MMTKGRLSVSPYNNDNGLNNGAESANADIAPGFTFARRISKRIGNTPIEQTGNSMPTNHDCGSERHRSPPNKRRVPAVPR